MWRKRGFFISRLPQAISTLESTTIVLSTHVTSAHPRQNLVVSCMYPLVWYLYDQPHHHLYDTQKRVTKKIKGVGLGDITICYYSKSKFSNAIHFISICMHLYDTIQLWIFKTTPGWVVRMSTQLNILVNTVIPHLKS